MHACGLRPDRLEHCDRNKVIVIDAVTCEGEALSARSSMTSPPDSLLWALKSAWSGGAVSVVLLLEWLFFAWFDPSLPMAGLAGVVGLSAIGLWLTFMLRSKALVQHRYTLKQKAQEERLPHLQQLGKDLKEVSCDQGVTQLELLKRKFESMTSVLVQRLDAGELTYSRYLDTAEQVYLSAIDNLQEVAISLRSISTIDGQELEARLAELRKTGEAERALLEIETLEQRRSLHARQVDKVAHLLVQNETAMTAIDHASGALADARMGKGHASIELDQALRDLDQLARRAQSYAAISRH